MREIINVIKCDICGSDMNDGKHHGLSQFTMEYISRFDVEEHDGMSGYDDICLDCNRKIIGFIRQIEIKGER